MNASIRWESFWFKQVPAYRLALFRAAIAITTIIFVIPRLNVAVQNYLASSFHIPMLSWLPTFPACTAQTFKLAEYAAAACLLIGFFPRLAAGFLAVSGLYVFLLDAQHYSHWGQFHLIILILLTCSKNNLSLIPLFRKDSNSPSTCEVWPEHLIRLQLSIVLLYTALDKVFSPYWGTSGSFFNYEFGYLRSVATISFASSPLAWLRAQGYSAILAFPALSSITTIGVEFFLAVSFLFRPLWRIAVPLGFLFAILLQVFISPISFAWEFMAILILFL